MNETQSTNPAIEGKALREGEALRKQKGVRRTVVTCVSVVAAMVGAAYAAVPLYDLFCRVTGFGGTPMIGTEAPGTVLDETVRVRFVANTARNLDWRFAAEAPSIETRIGDTQTVFYSVTNRSDQDQVGMATFNVTPEIAGQFFVKLQCFCFEENRLAAGETMDSAVMFYIDPAILDHPVAREIRTITLSYTYFLSKNGEPVAAGASLDTAASGTPPT